MAPQVSILINNWNYAEYLGQAIDSALAQTYSEVETIVVDDGSTDGSGGVLARYADRVTVLHQENAGQPAAAATALAACSGDIVIFLDADDYLMPEAADRVVAAWDDDCAKVQFRLSIVDRDGVRLGADPPPHTAMPNGDLVPAIATNGWYESPVTSGNAYPRTLVERLFPIPSEFHNIDGYLNTVTPFYGQVISIEEELGAYRQHGGNRWAFSDRVDVGRIRRRLYHDLVKERYIERTAAITGRPVAPGSALRNPMHVLYRLASLRLAPHEHPVPEDRAARLVSSGLRALRADPYLALPDMAFIAAILLTTAVVPRPAARRAVEFALLSRPRPTWLRALARGLRRGSDLRTRWLRWSPRP